MATLAERLAQAQTELDNVNAAIARITGTPTSGGAQSYSTGGNNITRANLDTLYKRQAELQARVDTLQQAAAGSGGNFRVAILAGR
jgi:hypothetical protein